jgi:hypothetical protein
LLLLLACNPLDATRSTAGENALNPNKGIKEDSQSKTNSMNVVPVGVVSPNQPMPRIQAPTTPKLTDDEWKQSFTRLYGKDDTLLQYGQVQRKYEGEWLKHTGVVSISLTKRWLQLPSEEVIKLYVEKGEQSLLKALNDGTIKELGSLVLSKTEQITFDKQLTSEEKSKVLNNLKKLDRNEWVIR